MRCSADFRAGNLVWGRVAGELVLGTSCSGAYSGDEWLRSLFWERVARKLVPRTSCSGACSGDELLGSLFWGRVAGELVLGTSCWGACSGDELLRSLFWERVARGEARLALGDEPGGSTRLADWLAFFDRLAGLFPAHDTGGHDVHVPVTQLDRLAGGLVVRVSLFVGALEA